MQNRFSMLLGAVMVVLLAACNMQPSDAHAQAAEAKRAAPAEPSKDQPTIPRGAKGKRAAPAEVPAVKIGNVHYEVLHWGRMRDLPQNGGYLVAKDAKGQEILVQQIYSNVPDPKLEADVQDVFITSLRVAKDGKSLEIQDEQGRKYRFDPVLRKVLP
jgi:hypothetical protein